MKLLKSTLLVTFTLACSLSKPVLAHKLNSAESTFNFNPRSESIEIIHKFYLHDVEHLERQYGNKQPEAAVINKYQVFTEYILKTLSLKLDNKISPTSYLGSEIEGKYFYIYEKTTAPNLMEIKSIKVDITAMQNVWKPNYWLFSIDLGDSGKSSFALDKNNFVHTSVFNRLQVN